MRIQCPKCKCTINLKEGSYPTDKSFSFSCPKCGHKIRVSNTNGHADDTKLYGEKLKEKILNSNNSLPPIPEILTSARNLLSSTGHTTGELNKIIKLDQAIAARVLKLANSAFFNFKTPVPSIEDACLLLGEENLMSILAVAELSKMLVTRLNGYEISKGDLFLHSVAVAVASDLLANEKAPLFSYDAFSAGLLHDCGKIVLNDYIYANKKQFLELVEKNKVKCFEAETIMFGFSHGDIAFKLLESWNLPEIQTHAIGYHHYPKDSGMNELSYILNVADFLAVKAGFSASTYCVEDEEAVDEEVFDFLSIKENEIPKFIEFVKNKVTDLTRDYSV